MGHKTVTFSEDVHDDPDGEALRESTAHMDAFLPDADSGSEGEEAAKVPWDTLWDTLKNPALITSARDSRV